MPVPVPARDIALLDRGREDGPKGRLPLSILVDLLIEATVHTLSVVDRAHFVTR